MYMYMCSLSCAHLVECESLELLWELHPIRDIRGWCVQASWTRRCILIRDVFSFQRVVCVCGLQWHKDLKMCTLHYISALLANRYSFSIHRRLFLAGDRHKPQIPHSQGLSVYTLLRIRTCFDCILCALPLVTKTLSLFYYLLTL